MFNAVATQPDASPPTDLVYANWDARVYQYDRQAALESDFGVGSVTLSSNYRLLVMDTMRSATHDHGDEREIWGYGYRFIVEVSDASLAAKLTLPSIAAAAEGSEFEASVRLEVKGYDGNELWNVIPPLKPLDVETYAMYLSAVSGVQKAFADHPEQAKPVLLARSRIDEIDVFRNGVSDPELAVSVAIVRSLEALAGGVTLSDAAEQITSSTWAADVTSIEEAVRMTYEQLLSDDDPASPPSDAARARARAHLDS